MEKNIFDNYASSLKNTSTHDEKYDENYFKTFYLQHLPNNRKCSILDLGCGSGKYLKILKSLGYENFFGVDISEEQIKIAKEFNLNVQCQDALEFLKNSTQKYDIILLVDVLEHLDLKSSLEIINLIYKSLNSNGKLLIQVPNALSLFSPLRYSDITHQRAYTKTSMIQTLNSSEFKIFKFFELYPYIHGIKSFVRNILWHLFIKKFITLFLYTAYGTNFGKIYSANFLCICEK